MEQKEQTLDNKTAWLWNWRAWKLWWKLCPGLFIAKLLSEGFKTAAPYVGIFLSARLIDELAGGRDPKLLTMWALTALGCGAGLAFLAGIAGRWANYENGRAARLDDRIYIEKMLKLDYADIDRQYVYDLYSQIMQNENWAGWGIYRTISYFERAVNHGIQLIGGIILSAGLFFARVDEGSSLSWLNHPLWAALMLGFIIFVAVAASVCGNKGLKMWNDYADTVRLGNRYFSFFGTVTEDRKRALDIRTYKQQENICVAYLHQGNMFGPESSMAQKARGPLGGWVGLAKGLSATVTGGAYLFTCLKAWAGAYGIGAVTQYVGALTLLFKGICNIMLLFGELRANGFFMKDAFEFLDLPNNMYQGSLTTEKRSDRQYEIEFRDVSFKYPGSQQWALRHVNLSFKVGSRLAVVGVNGSGKTTFIKLLCRLYDPTEGQILLNGIDIRKYSYDDYMDIFSVVFQDFKLLARPIRENVGSSLKTDAARAARCLHDAGFDTEMAGMPRGIETPLYKDLDENGVDISGGEAQKIAIARALYKDAPFIILDEPTAALDPMAEAEIYSKFDDIAGDKTAIYISHRLSSCKFCDEIVVFDAGHIVQKGTHEALAAASGGVYAALWEAQAGYYNQTA